MNFRRIEWIFLVAFVVLDIFLAYMFVQTSSSASNTKSTTGTTATIIHEMRDDNISFSNPSGKENTGYYIAGNNDSGLKAHLTQLSGQATRLLSNGKVSSTLRTTVAVDADHPEKSLNQFIAQATNVIHGNEYVYSEALSSSGDYVYVQKVADGKILTGTGQIHFTVNRNHQLIGYTQGYLNNVKTLREKAVTISEKKALVALYQYNQVSNNSRIVWGKLGYSRLLKLKDSSVYVPTWVFAVRSKNSSNISIRRINAFTGAAMKTSTGSDSTSSDSVSSVAAGMIWNAE